MEEKYENKKDNILKQRFRKRSVKIISFLHLGLGLMSVIAEITKISASSNHKGQTILSMGEGFYCGIIFMLTGLAGFLFLSTESVCKVTVMMVLNIMSAVFGGWLLLVSGCIIHGPVTYGHTLAILIHGVLIFCGVMELLLGIVCSSLTCRAACPCCQDQSEPGTPVLFTTTMQGVEVKRTGAVELNVNEITEFKQQVTEKPKIEVGDIQNNVGQIVAKTQGYSRFP